MRILGISAFYRDSAAALVEDGRIVAAAQEERFSRKKHDAGFPHHAIAACLAEGGIALDDVDLIVFYEKPLPQQDALCRQVSAAAPDLAASPKLRFAEHHLCHAASAFFPSPFSEAVTLTIDGLTDRTTAAVAVGCGGGLRIDRRMHQPNSLALLYSAVTHYIGFKIGSGEYKVMGLAPYGRPRFKDVILERLLDLAPDGGFRLDPSFFDAASAVTAARFAVLFGQPPRAPEQPLTPFHMDMAASVQAVTEEALLRLTRSLAAEYDIANLCLGGGVALNCVANGKLLRDGAFKRLWVQPASGNAGGAVGAALTGYHLMQGGARIADGIRDGMRGSFLGPAFAQPDIEARLARIGARFDILSDDEVIEATARSLIEGKAVGWFQGRMEFGPRALGGRSILGDPRSPWMQKTLNLRVKYRESFRPFAPSVLREDASDWFELEEESPYMLIVADVRENRRRAMTEAEQALFGIDKLNVARSDIPAATHVDYSARIQTVDAETNPRYHALISRFKAKTGCPVLVNTSFNVRGEPIVASPEDAFRCFMGSEIEVLAVGNCFLRKEAQDPALKLDYRSAFAPD